MAAVDGPSRFELIKLRLILPSIMCLLYLASGGIMSCQSQRRFVEKADVFRLRPPSEMPVHITQTKQEIQ